MARNAQSKIPRQKEDLLGNGQHGFNLYTTFAYSLYTAFCRDRSNWVEAQAFLITPSPPRVALGHLLMPVLAERA